MQALPWHNVSGPAGCISTPPALTIINLGVQAMTAFDSLPKTCGAAKAAGEKFFFTGKPCKYGHLEPRRVSDRKCVECGLLSRKRWGEKNYARVLESNRAWASANLHVAQSRKLRWREANPDKVTQELAVNAQWYKDNPAWARAKTAFRRAVFAAPIALQYRDEIAAIYREAARRSAETGKLYDVDHIIPLKGRNVCGLHVPANLQILTAAENRSKGNKHAD